MNAAAVLAALILALYFITTLALLIARIVAPERAFDTRIGTILAFIAFAVATIAMVGWLSRYANKPKVRLVMWRSSVLIRFVFFGTALILFTEVLLRTTDGLLFIFGLNLLSRISDLTALLIPACLTFPIAAQLALMAGSALAGACGF
jgi:hypothetical protein